MKAREPQTHPHIEAALEQLRGVIRSTVRAEQLVDQLTKLSNDDALNEWIQQQLVSAANFWLAFVEVDRFKSVNDEFGYDDADELLRQIAGQLTNAATSFSRAELDRSVRAVDGEAQLPRGTRRLQRVQGEVHRLDRDRR